MIFFNWFWYAIIVFSLVSFTYLSLKVLYKGLPELKTMFAVLQKEKEANTLSHHRRE